MFHIQLRILFISVLLLISTLLGNEKSEFSYHDPILHYSITLPASWKRTPQKDLLTMREETKSKVPSWSEVTSHLSVGFYLEGNYYFKSPYIYIYNYKKKLDI